MALFLIFATALAVVTYFSLRKLQLMRELPSEPANFFLGNMIEMLSPTAHLVALRWRRRHGPVYQAWASIFKRIIFVCDPDIIQHITVKLNARKDDHYEMYTPFIGGDALFTCLDTGRWRTQRRQLVHAFAPERIKQQHCIIAKYVRQLIVRLDAAVAADRPVDIDKEMLLLGMDIIGETLMGRELQALKNGDSPVLQRLKYILIHLPPFAAVPARLRWLFPSYRRMMQMSKELHAELEEVINSRRPEILANWETTRTKSLFELLLTAVDEEGKLHPIDVVSSNVFTFLVAGHDTTAHTLAYAFYELGRNPTAYQKLHEQVDAILHEDVPPSDLLSSMPYVKMVVKETLRMHPTGRGTVRMLDEPLHMKGYHIPANTTLPIMNYTVHYDEELWPEPETFRPERFEQPLKHPCAFIPFSFGPRNCIGKGFGMFEAQIVLAALARRYDWSLAPGYKLQDFAGAFVTPANGIHVCLRHKPTAVAAS